jgi:hypothetical protein
MPVQRAKTLPSSYLFFSLQRVSSRDGRALSQAVSHRLPTAAARDRGRVWSCGICGEQSGTGAGFLLVFPFPLPVFIPPVAPQLPGAGTIDRNMASVPRGHPIWTPPPTLRIKK